MAAREGETEGEGEREREYVCARERASAIADLAADKHLVARSAGSLAVSGTAKRTKWELLQRIQRLLPESQGQNLALTVLNVPHSLDSGWRTSEPAPQDALSLSLLFLSLSLSRTHSISLSLSLSLSLFLAHTYSLSLSLPLPLSLPLSLPCSGTTGVPG